MKKEEFRSLEDFGTFVSRRANTFRMTAPRFVKVENPQQELEELLKRLVGPSERSRREVTKAIAAELEERFRSAAGCDSG